MELNPTLLVELLGASCSLDGYYSLCPFCNVHVGAFYVDWNINQFSCDDCHTKGSLEKLKLKLAEKFSASFSDTITTQTLKPVQARPSTPSAPIKNQTSNDINTRLEEVRKRLRIYNGLELAESPEFQIPLEYLPLLGQKGYVVKGLSHLLAGFPRTGKTDLLFSLVKEWLVLGYRILYYSEEHPKLLHERLKTKPGNCEMLNSGSVLGANLNDLFFLAEHGPEEIIILDTFRNLIGRGVDEMDSSALASAVNPWIAMARKANKTLIMTHHSRKGGGQNGEGIAGGHGLMASFDIVMELLRDGPVNRRIINNYDRIISPPSLIYEKDKNGTFKYLGVADDLGLEEVIKRIRPLLTDSWRKTGEIFRGLGSPQPSSEQVRKALVELAEEGDAVRDPDISRGDVPGKTYRWKASECPI